MPNEVIAGRNRDIIWLLTLVLHFCDKMAACKRKWNVKQVSFKGNGQDEYYPAGDEFADKFFNCIYEIVHRKNTPKINLYITDMAGHEQCAESFNWVGEMKYLDLDVGADEKIEMIIDALRRSFVPPLKRVQLEDLLRHFLELRGELRSMGSPFPGRPLLEKYLHSYYQILTFLLVNADQLGSEEILYSNLEDSILKVMLSLDVQEHAASLLSPLALNQTLKMYRMVESYYGKMCGEHGENELLCMFYKNVILKKVQHSYRWFFDRGQDELWHAAVSPYGPKEPEGCLRIPVKPVGQLNSFEGIGELRLGEKILYEMEKGNWMKEASDRPFRIAVFGDVDFEPIGELVSYLENVLDSNQYTDGVNYALKWDFYSKNIREETSTRHSVHSELFFYSWPDDIFVDSEKMSDILQRHDIVFMLDCIGLYKPIDINEEESSGYLRQRFVFGKPGYVGSDRMDLSRQNLFDELYEMMTVYSRSRGRTFGTFTKRANDLVLKFCEEQIGRCTGSRHTLFVYVSDLAAFRNVYCNDEYFVRTERYNQKEIGIIRYTNRKEERIEFPVCRQEGPDGQESSMICFNVWQVVKHLNLDRRKEIIRKILDEIRGGEAIHDYDLHRLYIGVDYRDWPNQLWLHYAVDKEAWNHTEKEGIAVEFLKKFIEKIVLPIFNDDREDMFQQYIWRAVYSFLYGDAKNVEDMLLIHLLHDKYELMGKTGMAEENNVKWVEDNINRKYKYSIKHFIETIIRKYDISAERSLDQMMAAFAIEKNNAVKGGKKKLFEDVRTACKNLRYENSYLYRNCVKSGG